MSDQTIHTTVSQPGRVGAHVESDRTLVESVSPPQQINRNDPDIVTKVVLSGRPGDKGATGDPGTPGAQGDPGPAGPPGAPGGVYTHHQAIASSVWVINHNLGRNPAVVATDSAGTPYEGDVHYDDPNNLTITFSVAFGGQADLS